FLIESREDCLITLVRRMGFEKVLDGFTELATSVFTFGKPIDFQELLNTQMQQLQTEKKVLMEKAGKVLEQLEALNLTASPGKEGEKARQVQERLQGAGKTVEDLTDVLKGVRLPGKTNDVSLTAYKECIKELRNLQEPLSQIECTEQAREELAAVYQVLEKFQEQIEQAKRSAGLLSFKDVAELAVEILIHNEDLRTWFKRKFKAILIDEFQDNNRLQKDLLFLLAEKEDRSTKGIPGPSDIDTAKLFFVGDEKQSIYRFRGADVRVFKHLSEELRGIGGKDVHLITNYRSHPSLIQFFNLLFQHIMPPVEQEPRGTLPAYEACFEPMEPPSMDSVRDSDGPHVHIFWKPYREEENLSDENEEEGGELHADEMEAYFLAGKIRDWVENRTLLIRDKESGKERPAEYRDFAILLRSTGNQIHYERMLRRLNIPYTTIGIRSLFLESPVNDMYAFLQCALYPEDRLAYATLLRSPFVHLGDEAFLEVLLQNKPPFEPGEKVFDFSPIDAQRFSRGRELYQELSRRVDAVSVPELLSYLWYEGGYRYTVLRHPAYHPYLELYDYLREFALLVPGETLAAFLDRLRPNLGKYERIPELTIQRDSVPGVQILTIHKAKGLEYPVVILANAGNRGRKGEGTNLFYLSEQYGLTITLGTKGDTFNYFYQKGKEENEAGEEAELKRLFYVACTRAESHLVISGCFNKQNRPSNSPKETEEAASSGVVRGERAFLPLLFRALQIPVDGIPAQSQSLFEIEMIPDIKEKDLEEEVETRTPSPFIPETVQALYEKEPFSRKMDQREYSVTGWVEQMNWLNQAAVVAAHPKDSEGRASVSAQVSPATGLSPEVDALFSGDDTPSLEEYFGSLCHGAVENRIM
ncbi:MAG TPA: 3'-5' exonuclease, partial [Spirochaetales bacterium]|nr:3'-5' exonuclease [Spirochaetales bacterium]